MRTVGMLVILLGLISCSYPRVVRESDIRRPERQLKASATLAPSTIFLDWTPTQSPVGCFLQQSSDLIHWKTYCTIDTTSNRVEVAKTNGRMFYRFQAPY